MNIEKQFDLIDKCESKFQQGGLRLSGDLKKKSNNAEPLISIITTVKNGDKYLQEAINSLNSQNYKNFEHIVIDGGSTDKTLEIIKKYSEKIDYWVSIEKDKGIYDGFNLGMKLSRGEYIGFLNSDDKFTDQALSILVKYINKNPSIDFIFGAVKKHWGILYGYKPWKIK